MLDHVAASDCERVRPGPVAQPVNTVTSLAYAGAGAWVARRARGAPPADRAPARAVGLALGAVGLGSVAYHGPGGSVGRWLHDTSNASLALLAALHAETGRRDRPLGGLLPLHAAGVAGLGALFAARPDASVPVTALVAGAAGGLTVRRRRGGRSRRRARLVAATALAAGVVAYAASRTGRPWCHPDSLLQGHGVWHVCTAVALAAWAAAELDGVAGGPTAAPPDVRPFRPRRS